MKRSYQSDHIVVRENGGRQRYGVAFDLDFPQERDPRSINSDKGALKASKLEPVTDYEDQPLFGSRLPDQDPPLNESRSRDPRLQDSRSRDPRALDSRTRDPQSSDSRSRDPRLQDSRNQDPGAPVSRNRDPRLQDSRSRDPRLSDSRNQDPMHPEGELLFGSRLSGRSSPNQHLGYGAPPPPPLFNPPSPSNQFVGPPPGFPVPPPQGVPLPVPPPAVYGREPPQGLPQGRYVGNPPPMFGSALPRRPDSPIVNPELQPYAYGRDQSESIVDRSQEPVFGNPPPEPVFGGVDPSEGPRTMMTPDQWKQFMEREKMKEELFRQFQAGLIQPNQADQANLGGLRAPSPPRAIAYGASHQSQYDRPDQGQYDRPGQGQYDRPGQGQYDRSYHQPQEQQWPAPQASQQPSQRPVSQASSSSGGNADMMSNILNMVMETGVRNPTQSNIEFLRTPEMRGLLRKIFAKEINSGSRSAQDRALLESLKLEIKGENPQVEEVTLSSDDESGKKKVKKEKKERVSDDDLEIVAGPSRIRNQKFPSPIVDQRHWNEPIQAQCAQTSRKSAPQAQPSWGREMPLPAQHSYGATHQARRERDNPSPEIAPPVQPSHVREAQPFHGRESRTSGGRERQRTRSRDRQSRRRHSSSNSSSSDDSESRRRSHRSHHRKHSGGKSSKGRHRSSRHRTRSPSSEKKKRYHQQRRSKSPAKLPDLRNAHARKAEHEGRKSHFSGELDIPQETSNRPTVVEPASNKPEKLFASVVGFIDGMTGILKITSKGKREGKLTIFHKENLWIMCRNVATNSLGVEKCVSPVMEDVLPMGTGVAINARELKGDVFDLQAMAVWPALSRHPEYTPDISQLDATMDIFRATFKLSNYEPLTFDCIKRNDIEIWSCKVFEFISEDWGIIEVKNFPKQRSRECVRLFCMFHKSSIWLKNGTPITQNKGDNRRLSHIVEISQPVNIVARSVIQDKGNGLLAVTKGYVHLQALVVSLDPDDIPDGATRGLILSSGPGTFGIKENESTSYMFNKSNIEKANIEMVKFLKESKIEISNLDNKCYEQMNSQAAKGSSKSLLDKRLLGAIARIKKLDLPNSRGVLENLNKTWCAVFRIAECHVPEKRKLEAVFIENAVVNLNAVLVKDKNIAQYMVTSLWVIGKPPTVRPDPKKELSAEQLHFYAKMNYILEGRDPTTIRIEYFDGQKGEICRIIDHNFGIISFQNEKAIFKLTEVWLSHESTAANRGLALGAILPVGTKVIFHCLLLNSTAEVKYMASTIWKQFPNPFTMYDPPKPIRMHDLPSAKLSEFRAMTNSESMESISGVFPNLSEPPPSMQTQVSGEMYEGTIKFSLQRRGEDFLSGGIIEFFPDASYPKKKSYAVFVTKGIPVALGQEMSIPKTRVLFQPIPRNKGSMHIEFIGNRVMKVGRPLPPGMNSAMEANGKEAISSMKHRDIMNLDNFEPGTQVLKYGIAFDHFFKKDAMSSRNMPAYSGGHAPPGKIGIRQIINGVGIITAILNENFAIIQFKAGHDEIRFCLFDTFDLLTAMYQKASDSQLSLHACVTLHEKVSFHAVELDKELGIGWLATAVWRDLPRVPEIIDPDTITDNKIMVFRQVTDTCVDLLPKLLSTSVFDEVSARKASQLGSCPVVVMQLTTATGCPSSIPAGSHLFNAHMDANLGPGIMGVPPPPVWLDQQGWTNRQIPPGPQPVPPLFGRPPPLAGNGVALADISLPQPPGTEQSPKKGNTAFDNQSISNYSNYFKSRPVKEKEDSSSVAKALPVKGKGDQQANTSSNDKASKSPELSAKTVVDKALNKRKAQRKEELFDKKAEDFYKNYIKAGLGCEGLVEPNPEADMSDGQWEDAMRKWKIRIVIWLKNPTSKAAPKAAENVTKKVEAVAKKVEASLLPLSLSDATTVGEVHEKFDHSSVILSVKLAGGEETFAICNTNRIWVKDHELMEGISHIKTKYQNKLRVYCRRIHVSGRVKYQVVYSHVGLAPNQVGGFKYSPMMSKFVVKCQVLEDLQQELKKYMSKAGEKWEVGSG